MNTTQKTFLTVAVLVLSVSTGFASEAEEEVPGWFPMLEAGGVLIGLAISAIAFNVYRGMAGGAIGTGFGRVFLGVLLITLGLAANGANEYLGFMSEFAGELTFELFIYAGLIMIGMGVSKVAAVLD